MSKSYVPAGHKLAYVLEAVDELVDQGLLSKEAASRIAWRSQQVKEGRSRFLKGVAKVKDWTAPPKELKPKKPEINIGRNVAILSGVGAGALATEHGLNAMQSDQRFDRMMRRNPDIKSLDQEKVRDAWSTLQDFAPNMTRDPFAAGSAVKKMTEYEAIDPETVEAYQKIENDQRGNLITGILRGVGSIVGV